MAKENLPQELNICFIAKRFPLLGRAANHGFLWPIAKKIASYGHRVSVLSWKNPQGKREIAQDQVEAYFLGETFARSEKDFPYLVEQKFEQLHRRQPFHVVHSIDDSGLLVGMKRRQYQVAMMYDVEATEMSQLYSIFGMAQDNPGSLIRAGIAAAYKFLTTYFAKDRRLLNTADGVFVTSPQQKVLLERHYLYPDLKTFIIPYGVELSDLSARPPSTEILQKFNIPPGQKIVVTITDMQEFGEIKNLLNAFEKVVIKKPNSHLIIAGNGPLFKPIEFEMLNLALGSKVTFTGAVNAAEIPNLISLADVFVDLSSRRSGFEPSLIEAMAQKKVIVGSELSPIATIVEDGKNGFLIRPADVPSLARILIDIFTEKVTSEEIGNKAREKVLHIFNTQSMVDLTLEAYKKTLNATGFYKSSWRQWTDNVLR